MPRDELRIGVGREASPGPQQPIARDRMAGMVPAAEMIARQPYLPRFVAAAKAIARRAREVFGNIGL